MTRRYVLWAIGVLLILAGAGLGWRAWVESTTTSLPPVAVPKPEVSDLDAPGEIWVDGSAPGPNDTLEVVARQADAILVVRLGTDVSEHVDLGPSRTTSTQRVGVFATPPPPPPMRHTIYSFGVREAIKGEMRLGERVKVARLGGRQTFEDDFPRPGVGEMFVVFLKWVPELGAYSHLYGPATTFRIVNGSIHPVGRYFKVALGRDAKGFVQELRKMVQQR